MTFDVKRFLSLEMGLGLRASEHLIRTAPERYKRYRIPKRTGGWREIAHPARELKVIQKALVDKLLINLPVHPAATAYVSGSSIRINATRHAENGPIMKYDFKDFFPSITSLSWINYCAKHDICEHSDAIALARLLFARAPRASILRLSIGAPSSPVLSNILMYDFDRRIAEQVGKEAVTYTRYADDMTFSAKRTGYLNSVDKLLRATIATISSPKLKINESKTVTATRKYHRQVTGLILTNDYRVSLGRDRKRTIRAALHHFKTNKLSIDESVKLAGHMAFAKDVEPEFYTRMERVYGTGTLEKLKTTVTRYRRPAFRD